VDFTAVLALVALTRLTLFGVLGSIVLVPLGWHLTRRWWDQRPSGPDRERLDRPTRLLAAVAIVLVGLLAVGVFGEVVQWAIDH